MKRSFPYESLHEYLDEQFGHLNYVSDQRIVKAKAEYKRMYNRWYISRYRETITRLSFSVSLKEANSLKTEAKKAGQTIGKYLKKIMLNTNHSHNTETIHLKVLELIDLVESHIHQGIVDLPLILTKLEDVEKKLRSCP